MGRMLTSAQIAEALGLSEERARALLWLHRPVGTVTRRDSRWLMPAERLDDLRQVAHRDAA